MHEPLRGRLPQGPRDMPWRPGGCITECDGLCLAERRPADMSRTRLDGADNPLFLSGRPVLFVSDPMRRRPAGPSQLESRRRRKEAAKAASGAGTPRGIKYGIDAPSTRTAEKVSGIDTPSKPTALKGISGITDMPAFVSTAEHSRRPASSAKGRGMEMWTEIAESDIESKAPNSTGVRNRHATQPTLNQLLSSHENPVAPPPGFEFPGIPLPGPTGVCGARLNSISPRGDRRYTGLSYGGDEAHYGGLYVFFADVQPVPESCA